MLFDTNYFISIFSDIKNNEEVTEEKFKSLLLESSNSYYTSEESILEDSEFDFLKNKFIEKYGYNPVNIGTNKKLSKGFKKEKHNIPMGSLIEFSTDVDVVADIKKWTLKYSSEDEYCTSEKIDGLSVSIYYNLGRYTQALTRGDGFEGDNITENVRKMKNIPDRLPEPITCYLRGEIALSKKSCSQYFPNFKNPRNGAVGLTKRLDGVGCEHLDVYFYKLYTKDIEFKKESEILDYIKNTLKLTAPRYYTTNLVTLIALHKRYETEVREKLDYLLDGLVVNINSKKRQSEILENELLPEYARKFKFESEVATTELLQVVHQVGRTGAITPVALLEPVVCGGTLIKRATLHNYDEIERLGLEAGDIVSLARSKDVIPKIINVVRKNEYSVKIKIPKECPVCGSVLEKKEAILYCTNDFCDARVAKSLIHWLNILNIQNMGEKIVEALIDAGKLKTIPDFYRLKVEDIANLEHQGDKNANKILKELSDKRIISLPELLAGLNIRNLSVKRAEILEDNFGNLEDILKVGTKELVAIDGFESILATFIVCGLKGKQKLIEEILKYVKIKQKTLGTLTGQSFCFSGFRNGDLEEAIKRKGGSIASGVSKKLNYLVVINKNNTTSKITKAKEYGTVIITPDDLKGILENTLF